MNLHEMVPLPTKESTARKMVLVLSLIVYSADGRRVWLTCV